uniref:Isoleucine--tRNA ligase n=1 Tax=uncultured euryarchaeote Alv-FOS5 TaxID=337891 RepID=Q3SB97_9EURY|nr:isoleucyl-tRNA synthetase [uncultured euryarchaeote Alv-FOS5]
MELKSENDVTRYWEEHGIEKKALGKEGPRYYFLDGPPYATGDIHVGTAWNKILKDYYLRYLRMEGYNVWAQPGYDTHGLPIENKVEKKLGLKNKGDIEKLGVENFIKECRNFATQYIGTMGRQFRNLGVWMDWEHPYLTLDNEYIENSWFTFKKAFEKGLLYKGKYPVHVCPHCQTVVAYNEIEYFKSRDPSIFVKFKVRGKDNEYLIIWTTTPWTLPANTGVMVHPKEAYVKVEVQGEIWILAKPRLEELMEKLEAGYRVLEEFPGEKLIGVEYENPLGDLVTVQKDVVGRVVPSAQFVEMTTGTGLVHCAPGHGKEDYKVGRENGLSQISPVGIDGRFTEEAGKYAGMYIKDANPVIIQDLKDKGALVLEETIVHDYPKCWRCDTPLIQISVPQWFFKISEIKPKLIEEAKKIEWHPSWVGKRFLDWLEGIDDWPISRQRYWGIPLPIWVCDKCGEIKVVGSVDELGEAGKQLNDLHRPDIDKVTLKCEKCGGTMHRVEDILDVWFDSGVAAWASLGYPKKEEPFNSLWPVKHVIEGPDQIRGWWNSSLICSVITMDRKPFDHIMYHGFVLDTHGVKMSKSKGNAVTTNEAIEKYSRDELRYYYLTVDYSQDMTFDWNTLRENRKFFVVLSNTYRFFQLYGDKIELEEVKNDLKPEDMWILSKINSLVARVTQLNKEFRHNRALKEIEYFVVNDLSRTYVKLIRDRTWPTYNGKDKKAAQAVLYYVLDKVDRLLAPAMPFFTERMYLTVLGGGKESIHLEDWPKINENLIDKDLEESMEIIHEITDAALSARQVAKIKLRWPIGAVEVVSEDEKVKKALDSLGNVLLKMVNAKSVGKVSGDAVEEEFDLGKVRIAKELSDDLLKEALASELIRRVQEARKKAGMNVDEKISLTVSGHPLLSEISGLVSGKVNAQEYKVGEVSGSVQGELVFQESKVIFGFDRV